MVQENKLRREWKHRGSLQLETRHDIQMWHGVKLNTDSRQQQWFPQTYSNLWRQGAFWQSQSMGRCCDFRWQGTEKIYIQNNLTHGPYCSYLEVIWSEYLNLRFVTEFDKCSYQKCWHRILFNISKEQKLKNNDVHNCSSCAIYSSSMRFVDLNMWLNILYLL